MPRLDHILTSHDGESRAVLGTVVGLTGSGYRRPGARILIAEDGSHVGAISGGCLERDVARHAWAWTESGPQTVLFDTRSSEFHPFGTYGTGCDGVVEVLLRRLPADPVELDHLAAIAAAQAALEPVVIAHLYHDTAEEAVGASLVWSSYDVRRSGDFPDALVESTERFITEVLETQTSIGFEARGVDRAARVFVEWVAPPVDLLIIGSGADAVALAEVAAPLGWNVRAAGADPIRLKRFGDIPTSTLNDPANLAPLDIKPSTRVVVMTHSLSHDIAALPALLASSASYVGLLGPKRRTARLMKELHAAGRLPDVARLDRLHTPVGLDIGGEDPWEVAVSIVSQIIAVDRGRGGGSLADRKKAIHRPHELRTIEVEL